MTYTDPNWSAANADCVDAGDQMGEQCALTIHTHDAQ